MTEAFPLQWPAGWPRTPRDKREDARNRWGKGEGRKRRPWTFSEARDELVTELERSGSRDPVISTNFRLTLSGLASKNFGVPEDQGVAVYFTIGDKPMVMAQDGFSRAEENLRSLALVLKYLRGVETLGGGVMMERAFEGFTAIAPPKPDVKRSWRQVLRLNGGTVSAAAVEENYRRIAKEVHPDKPGGSHAAMAELNRARDEALAEIG